MEDGLQPGFFARTPSALCVVCGNPVFPISECTDLESASMMVMERDVAKLRSKTRGLQAHPPPSLSDYMVVGG